MVEQLNTLLKLFAGLLTVFFLLSCSESPETKVPSSARLSSAVEVSVPRQKVLFVNSYHRGYSWSDGITKGVFDTFGAVLQADGQIDISRSKVDLKIIYLDTKRHWSEDFKRAAALKARELIESWKPDLVITADDNAAKYLIVPYYKETDLPFVFCGINQDATKYGFPTDNITGMIEVFLLPQTLKIIQPYARGTRICALGANTISEHKNIEFSHDRYGVNFNATYADSFIELQNAYRRAQTDCDMLFLFEFFSVQDFDSERFKTLIREGTRIPTASLYSFAKEYVLASTTIVAVEQGEWAAEAALEILSGRRPVDIPVSTNHKAITYLNMQLAKKLGIVFPMETIEQSIFVGEMSQP